MKRTLFLLVVLVLISLGCSLSGVIAGGTDSVAPVSEQRCGDGVCDGPENAQSCPGDCTGLDAPETNNTQQAPTQENQPESGYRYVSMGGTIYTTPNTAAMGDFTGTAFGYTGDYQIELWFPLQGGNALQQRNTITLTEFNDLYFDSEPCVWTLDERAFEPVSFELVAALTLNAIQENDQPADELSYQLIAIPQEVIGGVVQCSGSPGDFSDPAAFPVLTSWFTQGISNPIKINVIESNSVERQSVNPMVVIDIPKETLSYIIVPDLNTP